MSDTAIARIEEFLTYMLQTEAIGGLSVAITDRTRTVHLATHGFADIAARAPVTSSTRFPIGSVGKTFTSVAILQQVESGRLDLHAPVTAYLPWLTLPQHDSPITLHHLLSHTAGLPGGMDATPSTYYEVWSLGQSNLVARPGERWHYSNVGYKILGLILEQVLERPYREIIQEFILHRLDMHQTSPVITHDSRQQLAIGYDYLYDDRPPYASQPLVPARWIETDSGDGAIAASAEDLARFVRMLMSRGRGPRQHVLSEDSFALMTQRISQIGPVHYYGYGLTTLDQAGHQLIQHRGGMPGYFAAICADMDAGIGVAVLSTGPGGDPISIAQFVLAAARAGAASTPLPSIPPAGDRTWVANAAEYAGRYTGASRSFTIEDVSPQLALVFDDQRIILEPRGLDQFYANHPAFDRLLLCFGRDRHRVVEAGWGSEWFRHERWSGPTSWQVPAMWAAYPGHYRSYGPFLSNVRVVLRKDQLRLIYPWGDERVLLPEGDATFQVDEPVPMRIQFDTVVVGKALRVRLADAEYYRFFTS